MTSQRERFTEMLERFDNAMLVTTAADGSLHARPMVIARADEDGTLWFLADLESDMVDEALSNAQAVATMQGDASYLSISGTCRVRRDEAMLSELRARTRFRSIDGWLARRIDRAVVIELHGHVAEYWRRDRSTLRLVFNAARAAIRGEGLSLEPEHGRLELN